MPKFFSVLLVALVLSAVPVARAGGPPSWSKKIDGGGRFKVLKPFDDVAVLDKETGLVWEKTATIGVSWRTALRACAFHNTGGRMGWRVPSLEELLTLADPSNSSPATPDGAPFEGLVGSTLWTANEEEDPTLGVVVNLDVFGISATTKTNVRRVLCVRGGSGSSTPVRGVL